MKKYDPVIAQYILENYGKKTYIEMSKGLGILNIGIITKYVNILVKEGKLTKMIDKKMFSKEEEEFIINNALIKKNKEIADCLGRDTSVINSKKKLLIKAGLIPYNLVDKKPFTKEEEQILKDNFWEHGCTGCAKLINRSAPTISHKAKRMGLKIRPDILFDKYNITHFTEFKDAFVVYFLGFFWADGTITPPPKHRIKFKINSIDFQDLKSHLHRLGDFWNNWEYAPPKDKPHWKNSSVFEVTNLYLWQFFEKYGYLTKTGGSADKILAAIPENLRHYWWRGYFDGDGCISMKKFQFNACMNQDWNFLKFLELETDTEFTIERKDRGNRAGSKAIISNHPYISRVYNYIYKGEQFGLKRKYLKLTDYINNVKKKPVGATSQYWGVSKDKRTNSWTLQIRKDNKVYHKRFKNELDAALEYDKLAKEYFGNKATLNFPDAK